MKRVAIFVLVMVAVMGAMPGKSLARNWAANWFELTESEKNVLVAGYRLGTAFICATANSGSISSKLICVVSKADLDKYVELPPIISGVYKVEKYKYISVEWIIYISLLYLENIIDEKKFFTILDGFSNIESEHENPDSSYKLRKYEDMVKNLLQ